MDELVIKKYSDVYFEEVVKLLKSIFDINNNIDLIEDNDNSFSIIATIDEKVVGHIRVDKLKNIGKNCYYYYLNYICVDSNYQNKNIGTALLNYIFEYAKGDNIKYIELTSNKKREVANHLYLKKGFTIRDTNVFKKDI